MNGSLFLYDDRVERRQEKSEMRFVVGGFRSVPHSRATYADE